MAKPKKPAGHKAACACPFCKRARKGSSAKKKPAKKPAKRAAAKRPAKRPAKKSAAKRPAKKHAKRSAAKGSSYMNAFHEGRGDHKAKRPLRHHAGRRDAYSRGYGAGVRAAREEARFS